MKIPEIEMVGTRGFEPRTPTASNQAADFSPDKVLSHFFETGLWDATREELLAKFFLLARAFR